MTYFEDFLFFDIGELFKLLYNAMISLTLFVNHLWGFLNSQFGYKLEIPFIGAVWGVTFTPLDLIGSLGIIALITLWLVKSLVPVA